MKAKRSMHANQTSAPRIIGLDIARAAAVLAVLVAHWTGRWGYIKPIEIAFRMLGHLGVELFFVLSGFLIGGMLLRQSDKSRFALRDAPHFWKRRLFRTLPNYALFLLVFFYIGPLPTPRRILLLYPVFAQNLVVNHDDFFCVSWSLCVEEWMYLILPLLLAVNNRLTPRREVAAIRTIVLLLLMPLLLRLLTSYGRDWDLGMRHIVVYNLDAIGYGILLAYIAQYRQPLMRRLAQRRSLYLGLALTVFLDVANPIALRPHGASMMYLSPAGFLYMHIFYMLASSLAMFLIVAYLSGIESIPDKWSAIVSKISLWSYSLYLSHTAVIALVDRSLSAGNVVKMLLCVALTFPISWFVFTFFEKPIMDLR